ISHNRARKADITHGYTSAENPRFILHDSQGFEAGSNDNWDKAEEFLWDTTAKGIQDRHSRQMPSRFLERLIRQCVE
ncbi:hypothetical protein B0H34DRAFT_663886, partial [Crassisporium funariophilum]